MAMTSGSSDFFKKIKPETEAAMRRDVDAPIKSDGIQRLPGGILGGIAKLTKCGFSKYKQGDKALLANGNSAVGEYYFRAEGVVIEPVSIDIPGQGNIRVAGRTTSKIVNCFDDKTKKETRTQETNLGNVRNYLKMMGATKESLEEGTANYPSIAQALLDPSHPVYFEFSTTETTPTPEYPNKMVFEHWIRKRNEYAEVSSNGRLIDNTATHAETTESATESASGSEAESVPESTTEVDENSDEFLDDLVVKADNPEKSEEKKAAAVKLSELADSAGISKDVVDAAESYADVAKLIKEKRSGEQTSETGSEQDTPKLEEVYHYVKLDKNGDPIIDTKTKKPFKPISVTIKKVNDNGTVNVVSNSDKKPINNIPFAKLLPPS